MAFVDDVVIVVGAGMATASLVVLLVLLSRYRVLVNESRRSTELAKNLWDAMNARLTSQDLRIVDLMARFEVYSVKQKVSLVPTSSTKPVISQPASQHITSINTSSQPEPHPATPPQSMRSGNDTEIAILRCLAEGPRSSSFIRDTIQVSREHNARLLKALFEKGLLMRNDSHKPFVYEITSMGKDYLSEV